jgi:hypothetical protein
MVKVGSYVHIPAIEYNDMHLVSVYKATRETEFMILDSPAHLCWKIKSKQ